MRLTPEQRLWLAVVGMAAIDAGEARLYGSPLDHEENEQAHLLLSKYPYILNQILTLPKKDLKILVDNLKENLDDI